MLCFADFYLSLLIALLDFSFAAFPQSPLCQTDNRSADCRWVKMLGYFGKANT